jgi:putative flippase GtrA
MITFTKAQITSVLATGVDFVVTILLVQVAGAPYLPGSAAGTVSGGAVNFLISRNWVFNAQEKKWAAQLPRFVLVWIGSMVLNVSGLYLLTHFAGINYLISKIVIAIGVAVFYNYVLQKRFVFK